MFWGQLRNKNMSGPRLQNKRRLIGISLAAVAGVIGLMLWSMMGTSGSTDTLFRGKPESEWSKNLKYSDNEQVKEWLGYGKEGVEVLVRGLKRENHSGQRMYRKYY